MPTLGPCPMCRELVSLFDLRLEGTTTVDDGPSSLAYGGESDVSSWPGETYLPLTGFSDMRFSLLFQSSSSFSAFPASSSLTIHPHPHHPTPPR